MNMGPMWLEADRDEVGLDDDESSEPAAGCEK